MLRDTTSRGLCVRVWSPHTSERRGGGGGCARRLARRRGLCCFVLLEPTWMLYRVPTLDFGACAFLPFLGLRTSRSRGFPQGVNYVILYFSPKKKSKKKSAKKMTKKVDRQLLDGFSYIVS